MRLSINKVINNADRLVVCAALLCITGMIMCVPIFFKITGWTLFLFMTPGLGCIFFGLFIYSVVILQDFKRRHTFFKQDTFPAGTTIFKVGYRGEEVFLIKSGEVEIFQIINGEKQAIKEFKEGDHFGERALFEKRRRKATAVAKSDLETVIISQDDFEDLVRYLPDVRENFMEILKKTDESKWVNGKTP